MTNSLQKPIVEELAQEIQQKRKERLEERLKPTPRDRPYLSDIGECDRQITYSVLNWQDRQMWDAHAQARMNEGTEQGEKIKRELMELGYRVVRSEESVEVRGRGGVLLSRGRIDFMLEVRKNGGKPEFIPVEVKSLNPNLYNQITSLEDFQKKPWMRRYTRQLQMYLFGTNKEYGLFLISDCLGHWRFFPVYLSYEDCEWTLQRLERVHEHIQKKTYPDRITYREEICGKCPFVATCLPDQIHEGMEIIDDGELEKMLERREELRALSKEYEEIDEEVKSIAKRVDKDILVGKYSIFLKKGERVTYDVPAELKLAHRKTVPTVTVKIVKNETESK